MKKTTCCVFIKLALILLIFTVPSNNVLGQKRAYKKAVKTHTVTSYKAFIKAFPESDYLEEINEKLINLEIEILNEAYKKAIKTHTVTSYKAFLEEFPGSTYLEEINEKLINLEFEILSELKKKAMFYLKSV